MEHQLYLLVALQVFCLPVQCFTLASGQRTFKMSTSLPVPINGAQTLKILWTSKCSDIATWKFFWNLSVPLPLFVLQHKNSHYFHLHSHKFYELFGIIMCIDLCQNSIPHYCHIKFHLEAQFVWTLSAHILMVVLAGMRWCHLFLHSHVCLSDPTMPCERELLLYKERTTCFCSRLVQSKCQFRF